MNKSTPTFLGTLLGFILGVTLFIGVTTAVIATFFRLLRAAPNPAVDHIFGETLFWVSPLFLLGLVCNLTAQHVNVPFI